MCSVICRVGFEFISLSIQLENISNKPKMNSTRLRGVKPAKLAQEHLEGRGAQLGAAACPWHQALPEPRPRRGSAGGSGQGTAAASPGALLTRICHSSAIFHLRPPQRWQLIRSTSQEAAHVSGRSERSLSRGLVGISVPGWGTGGTLAELGWEV